MDWEQWLRASASPPSDTEAAKATKTEAEIRAALRAYAPLQGKGYRVYAKGSYANNTNVRLNYDVDIAVEFTDYFMYDLDFELEGQPASAAGITPAANSYTIDQFKRDIHAALNQAFGSNAVKAGRIAYRVREKQTTLPADVVPCVEYHRYDRRAIPGGRAVPNEGVQIFPTNGRPIINYPAQQLAKGNAKNGPGRTNHRYKQMVRALKRLQTRLVDQNALPAELPSYLIECLVYNVPDRLFGNATYVADMRQVLATIYNATLQGGDANDWVEVNELMYLFQRSEPMGTLAQVHGLAHAAWEELGFE